MNNYPTQEGTILLIDLILRSHSLTLKQVQGFMGCSEKTAHRLMNRLGSMNHEITFADFEIDLSEGKKITGKAK